MSAAEAARAELEEAAEAAQAQARARDNTQHTRVYMRWVVREGRMQARARDTAHACARGGSVVREERMQALRAGPALLTLRRALLCLLHGASR